jgi:hypothetical protein
MLTYEQRCDMITMHAWETWTKNGNGMDDDMRRETERTVQDAVNNTYCDGIADTEWLATTLRKLGCEMQTETWQEKL